MAITYNSNSSWTETATTTVDIVIGGTPNANSRVFAVASWKDFSITATCASSDGSWTEITEFADGSTATGNGTGSMKVGAWYWDGPFTDSSPTITFTAGTMIGAGATITFDKASSETWDAPAFATAAIPAGSTYSVSASSNPGITAGDVVIALVGIRDDGTITHPGTGIDCTGITWTGAYVDAPPVFSTTTGNDMGATCGYRIASTGTGSAAPSANGTLAASETGAALFIRQRVTGVANVPYRNSYIPVLPQ